MYTRAFQHALCAIASTMLCASSGVGAETFPTKPIRIVVPASPGGATDITTRLVAQKMSEKLGQPIVVDNRSGGETLLGTRMVKIAPADGYTILAQASTFSAMPALKLDPGYDPVKDFVAIGPMLRAPQVMYIGADQPDRTLAEFIARAKANPGKLSYAHGGVGSPLHVGAEQFLNLTGLNVLAVPYKGTGNALPDVISGRVTVLFAGYSGGATYVQAGKLRALGVTGNKRLAAAPDVPTFTEQGINFIYDYWLGLLVPAGTPKDVVKRLHEALQYAIRSKELADRFRGEGSEPATVSPEEFDASIAQEVKQIARLMSDLKIPKD